jgi:hypothetical protein
MLQQMLQWAAEVTAAAAQQQQQQHGALGTAQGATLTSPAQDFCALQQTEQQQAAQQQQQALAPDPVGGKLQF